MSDWILQELKMRFDESLEVVEKQSERIAELEVENLNLRLINKKGSMKHISELEERNAELQAENYDIKEYLQQVIEEYSQQADDKYRVMEKDGTDDCCAFCIPANNLKQELSRYRECVEMSATVHAVGFKIGIEEFVKHQLLYGEPVTLIMFREGV